MNQTKPLFAYEKDEKRNTDCAIGQLLCDLFNRLDREGVVYAVLRNYRGLPDKPGRDLDILTNDYEKFHKILRQLAEQHHYYLRIFRRYVFFVKFQLIRLWPEDYKALEIDLAWSVSWKVMPLVSRDLVKAFRISRGMFYTLRPGAEAAVSLTKLLYEGKVPEKYKAEITAMVLADCDGFLETLKHCFGSSLSRQLADLVVQQQWDRIAAMVSHLRRQAAVLALRREPWRQIGRWSAFLWWNLVKFFRPRGLFVVFLGPDGSGKSTVSEGVRRSLAPRFASTRIYHGHFAILPRLGDLARMAGFKPTASQTLGEDDVTLPVERGKFTTWRSLVYLIYYTLDYLLGHLVIFLSRGRGGLIIFDRYYYDYLIQPQMSLPSSLIFSVGRLIPKPDRVIYLKNNPAIIFSRKQELTLDELQRQGEVCERLISRLKHGCVVETKGTAQATILKAARRIVERMI
jgi:thymidylate kinase